MGLNAWMSLIFYTNKTESSDEVLRYKSRSVKTDGKMPQPFAFPTLFPRNFHVHVFCFCGYSISQLLRYTTWIDTGFFYPSFIPANTPRRHERQSDHLKTSAVEVLGQNSAPTDSSEWHYTFYIL